MRHLVSGRKLKRTSSHRKALLANLATELFRHKSIKTTEAKAKELRPYAESLITKAKIALIKEKENALPNGHTIDVHSRRIVAKHIRVKSVLEELFNSIAPAVIDRNGGYSRVIKTGMRQGDSARTAIIELVDFSAPQDGAFALKKRKKKTSSKPKTEEIQHIKAVDKKIVEDEIIEKNETIVNAADIVENEVELTNSLDENINDAPENTEIENASENISNEENKA